MQIKFLCHDFGIDPCNSIETKMKQATVLVPTNYLLNANVQK